MARLKVLKVTPGHMVGGKFVPQVRNGISDWVDKARIAGMMYERDGGKGRSFASWSKTVPKTVSKRSLRKPFNEGRMSQRQGGLGALPPKG